MNSFLGEKYTVELVALFEQQGPGLYSGQHSLCLTLPCLHYLQRKFTTLQEGSTDPISVQFPFLQQLQDNLAHIISLKLITDKSIPLPPTATLNVEPFRALQTLILKKVALQQVIGLQRLRGQLKLLVVQRCHMDTGTSAKFLDNIDDIIVRCCGDESTSFAWNSLKELDLSNNSISKLGDSLQYLPCLEKVNFSNNQIGPAPPPSSSSSSSSALTCSLNVVEQSLSASGASASLASASVSSISTSAASNQEADHVFTEGIECIDSVTSLHLGFNNLRCIPKFGSRAKYNLKILNLRNNQLNNIDGIRELERLVELDLTDNMLSKHMSLDPLQNLHHLSILILQGNPLAYHPKHRIKTTKHLSNLINRNNFRLDGKKLSGAEKKVISLTNYAPVPPAFSPVSSRNFSIAHPMPASSKHHSPFEDDQPLASSMPNPDHFHGNHGMGFASMPNTPKDRDSSMDNQKWRRAKLADAGNEDSPVAVPDDDDDIAVAVSSRKSGKQKSKKKEDHAPSANALLNNSQELDNYKHVREEMQESWLKTNPNPSGSTADDVSSSTGQTTNQPMSPSSSQPSQTGSGSTGRPSFSRSSSMKKGKRRRERGAPKKSKKTSLEEKLQSADSTEESGGYGPRASSPIQSVTSGDDGGDCFLVERYESDVEEEGGASTSSRSPKKEVKGERELMLVISERFLEEKSSMGDKFTDKWDLNTLQHASIDKKPWKSSTRSTKDAESQVFDVLSLQFNIERRDRSRREYVLLEEEMSETLLSLLDPIIQHNQESLSLMNRVECLTCQRVFDVSQAFEQPTDEPQPLKSSFAGRRRSLSKLLCPFCSSPILQYSMASASRSLRIQTQGSHSPGSLLPGAEPKDEAYPQKVVTSDNTVQSGFRIVGGGSGSDGDSSKVTRPSPLAEEKLQGRQILGDAAIANSFNREPSPKENSSTPTTKVSTEENLRQSESATVDDLSPWKKAKPTSLPVPPMNKVSLNPFDGLADDRTREPAVSNGAQTLSKDDRLHDNQAVESKEGPVEGATGKNPFEDSGGKNPFDDFEYGEEEPRVKDDVPEPTIGRARSGAISDAFTRPSANLTLSPMFENTETSMSVPAHYHFDDYMSQLSGRGRRPGSSSPEPHPLQTYNVTPPTMRKHKHASSSSGPSSQRNSYTGSSPNIDVLRSESGEKGTKSSSLDRGVRLRDSDGRVFDGGNKRYSSPVTVGSNSLSSKHSPSSPRRTPTGSHHRASSGSGAEMKQRVQVGSGSDKSSSGKGSRRNSGSLKSSYEGAAGVKGSSPLALYKDEDPSYIHNNLNLYLDMDVFNMDKGEHFKMVFKAPVMQYGHRLEIPSLVVVSSYKFYIFKITAPESTNAQQWLDLIAVHHLKKLVYIDHGVGHQYLRVEFSSESACYTFLIRNDKKCTLCATMLAHVVTDVSKSSFRTVGVVPFTVDSIRNPDRVLREVIMTRYDKIKTIRSGSTPTSSPGPSLRLHRHINPGSRPGSTTSMTDDDELMMYRLVRRIMPTSTDKSKKTKSEVKMTLVLTEQAIYLGKENFAQWPLPKVQDLPKRSELKPPFSNVHRKNINDVEQIVLDRDQSDYVCIRFLKESSDVAVRGEDDSKWTLMMHSAACVSKLVEAIKTQWEAQFEIPLPVLKK